jgi:hypothetical protein
VFGGQVGDIISLKTKSVFRLRSIDKQVSDQVLHRVTYGEILIASSALLNMM